MSDEVFEIVRAIGISRESLLCHDAVSEGPVAGKQCYDCEEGPWPCEYREDFDRLAGALDGILSRLERYEWALREIFAVPEGQEGRDMHAMGMHGFSPVRAVGRMRDIAGRALNDEQEAPRC